MNFIKLIIIIICAIILNLNFIKSQNSPDLDPNVHACGLKLLNDSIGLTNYKKNDNGLYLICGTIFACEGLYITKVIFPSSTPQTSSNIITGDYFSCFYNLSTITLTKFKINNDFLSNPNDFKTPVSVSLVSPIGFTPELYPTIAPTIFSIDLSGRSLTGQLTDSYCNVASLKLNSNQLTGTVPSCFLCYGKSGGIVDTNIFSGNLFNFGTYDYSTYVCDGVYATMRVNGTKIYLEGTKLGFDASDIHSSPALTWSIEQGSTRFVADYSGANDQIITTNIVMSNTAFTLRATTRAPSTESVVVTYNSLSDIYTATFQGVDFGYDPSKILIQFNEYPCVIVSTNFYTLVCTITSANGETIVMDDSMIIKVDLNTLPIKRFTYDYGGGSNYKEMVQCPNDCNSNGTCVNNFTSQTSACDCDPGNVGNDCHWPIQCLSTCKFGQCDVVIGQCICEPGVSGNDCSIVACKSTCLNNGVCDTTVGKCDCKEDYQGDDCSLNYVPCPTNNVNLECSGGGTCFNQTGECSCDQSHQSLDCSLPFIECPIGLGNLLCSGSFGSCNNQTGECTCDQSHQSLNCSIDFKSCPTNTPTLECSGSGQCNNQTGECFCDQGKIYKDCSETGIECKVTCLNGGICDIGIGACKCPSNYIDDTCSTPVHYLSSVDPCPSSGGKVVIYGWFSNKNTGLTITIGGLPCIFTDGDVTPDNITCTLSAGTGTKDVVITQNGSTFNGKMKFQYINTNNKCPNDCTNGQGICEPLYGQCTCNEGWTGFDCASPKSTGNDDLPQSITVINLETATSGISNQDTNYDIAILSLLEIDISSLTVKEHNLQSVEWNVTSDETLGKYNFIYQLPNSTCTIEYTIQEIKQDTKYEFAGMKLSIDKGGLKVSVSISNYSYQSSLNTLQLRFLSISGVIQTTEPFDNKCNEKESVADTTDVDPNQTLNYISITKNSKILAGRFINRVVSDNRATFMTSEVITSLSNSTSIVVGLNLPHCESSCLLDPDFSVLVGNDYKTSCSSNDSSRKWVIPVAVVVPAVAVSAISLVCVALYKKYRYNIRLFTMKKSFSIRQSFKLRNFK